MRSYETMYNKRVGYFILIILGSMGVTAQSMDNDQIRNKATTDSSAKEFTMTQGTTLPELGAQIWLEPSNTDEQIDLWFKTLADHELKTARLFIMWNYIEPEPGNWDFSLYDKGFDAAEKYGINIIVTLTTNRRAAHRGDFYQLHAHKLENTLERLNESKVYIEKVVNHWKDHPALESWMLTNEAAQQASNHPLAIERYRVWLKDKYGDIKILNKAWSTYFTSFDNIEYNEAWVAKGYWNWETAFIDFHTFWRNHLTWWLEWTATEVRKYDSDTPLHAHTQGVTGNLAMNSYDLPAWSKFTNTLGASIHPSWHFGQFERNQFPMAVSFCAELIRGSSDPHPFWVTELQGGQNLFSGGPYPLSPTENDIAQWTWTSIINDAEKVVYWILNNRSQGNETNEWSMLDFKSRPNERLIAAGRIAKVINKNKALFSNAKKYNARVTILVSLETMTHELYAARNSKLARSKDAHSLSVYGYYQTLLEMGIPVDIKHMHDFDWKNKENHLAIVPHAIAITKEQADNISSYVDNGNKLLMTGLSGMIDESSKSLVQIDWPLEKVVGAEFKDCRLIGDSVKVNISKYDIELPGINWVGELTPITGEIIAQHQGRGAAIKNNYGKGEAIFIPVTLGMAAWTTDNTPLSNFIYSEYPNLIDDTPVRFKKKQDKVILQAMQSNNSYIVMITNGKMEPVEVQLMERTGLKAKTLWGNDGCYNNGTVKLGGMETVVLVYK